MKKGKRIKIKSLKQMAEIAEKSLRDFSAQNNKNSATVILLFGDLGAGKTTFVQNIAKKMEIKEKINSPTFVISKKYKINNHNFIWKNLIHIDAYRLENEREVQNIGLDQELKNPENIIFIEWPEKIKNILPKNFFEIKLKYIGETEREMIIKYYA